MYVSSSSPIPPNAAAPGAMPSNARFIRTAILMARGRLSNQQCPPDMPRTPGGGFAPTVMASPVPSAAATSAAASGAVSNQVPLSPTMPATMTANGSVIATSPPAILGRRRRMHAASGRRAASGMTAAERQYVAEAPQMVTGDVAQVTCSARADEPQDISTRPQSAPPWGNAVVSANGNGLLASFQLGNWICEHPWLALVIAGAAGMVLNGGRKR